MEIQEQVPLGPYTTFKVGGPARYFARIGSSAELQAAVSFARMHGLEVFPLGGGSNVLVADAGYPGLVLHMQLGDETQRDGTRYEVAAGFEWNALVRQVCEQGLFGMECLAGIPGSVGASPIQNIGAYGQEVADTVETVHALDLETVSPVTLSREQCGFCYRTSIFNTTHRGRYLVTAITFSFDPAAGPNLSYADLHRRFAGSTAEVTPMEVYHAVRGIRRAKGMLLVAGDPDCRSAGSFFKNPVVAAEVLSRVAAKADAGVAEVPHWTLGETEIKLSAAWLVERAGFHKGYVLGAAGISSRHSLALINRGGARFADIVALRDRIVDGVEERFGIRLEQEPVLLGGSGA